MYIITYFSLIILYSSVYKRINKYIFLYKSNIERRSTFSSKYSSRKLLIHLNILFIPYYERMEIQNNNPSWSEQIDIADRKRFFFSYTTPKKEEIRTVK